ncbi:Haemagluttinin repeat-containing protein [Desulfomicrobium norvegicum]|uniref:Haemagluttinin repeat-containing protein n=1 Tax=Desulfomicrobium norvegicum (strain DSM 1741 / NCIMB 8310) TaxID=52561 RepID=A0A8G2C4A8_DESNO|nr:Haemagluttinin repeat-containing protein [Desulfomicrobium norvegicum]
MAITSATNTYSAGADSFSASASVGVGASYSAQGGAAAGIRVQAEAAGSENTSRAQTHANSVVAAGETLSVKSGADTTLAGANLEGRKVAMDVGGDLLVKSEQDKRAAAGSNWNAGGSVTFGYGFSADAHLGMGKSSADSAWVNRQTSVIGQEEVDIRTEKNTHVEGAVIAAKNGNLKLDTGTLTYGDIKDHDKSKNFQVSLSGSYSSGGDNTGPTFDGSYGSSDRRQVNRATIGEGEITIRSDPATGLEGLNRNLRRAQEITRDEQTSVVVYVDSSAIREIASGFEGIRGNLETLGELVKKVFPDNARLRDSVANQLSLKEKLIESGKSAEEAEALVQKYALYADLLGEIGKLVDAKGGWDNLTDVEAQEFLDSLMRDSRFVTLVASSDDSLSDSMGIVIGSGKFVLGAVMGGLEAAGSDAKSALFFLNDMSGYMLNKVSGGYLYQQEARNYTNTVNDFVNGIGYLVQHADEVGPAIVAGLEKKWNDYLTAFEADDYYEAGRLYGEFYYQISMLFIAGQGVAKSIMSGLKSAAPKFAATVEAAEAARVAKAGDGVVEIASKSVTNVTDDFFANTKFTNKVLNQMEQGDFHSFPKSVEGFQSSGKVTKIIGDDGEIREILKIQGTYKGKEGVFEFIKEADGTINHRFFRPNLGQ